MNSHLFDHLITKNKLKNDAELARRIPLAPSAFSKMRAGILSVGPSHMINIHTEFGTSIADIKALIARPRSK